MSFSSETKQEIIGAASDAACCQLAELSAMLAVSGAVYLRRGGLGLRLGNENAAVARRAFALVKAQSGVTAAVSVRKRARLNKTNVYYLEVPQPEAVKALLVKTGLIEPGEGLAFSRQLPQAIIAKDCCRRAYLRGAFLSGGTLSDPDKAYHLEIDLSDGDYAQQFCAFLKKFGLNAKIALRKENFVVYLKESESVIDFLSLAGASSGVFKLENTRILKSIRNSVNRGVNCESGNAERVSQAAVSQMRDIEYLLENDAFRTLNASLRETAELRLENPEANLTELGQLHHPPQSKSCINHRMAKLRTIANELREQKGGPDHVDP